MFNKAYILGLRDYEPTICRAVDLYHSLEKAIQKHFIKVFYIESKNNFALLCAKLLKKLKVKYPWVEMCYVADGSYEEVEDFYSVNEFYDMCRFMPDLDKKDVFINRSKILIDDSEIKYSSSFLKPTEQLYKLKFSN